MNQCQKKEPAYFQARLIHGVFYLTEGIRNNPDLF